VVDIPLDANISEYVSPERFKRFGLLLGISPLNFLVCSSLGDAQHIGEAYGAANSGMVGEGTVAMVFALARRAIRLYLRVRLDALPAYQLPLLIAGHTLEENIDKRDQEEEEQKAGC
jgi:hypothetical protein